MNSLLIDFLLTVGLITTAVFIVKVLIIQSRCFYWAGHDAMFVACNFRGGLTVRVKVLAVIRMFLFALVGTLKNELRGERRLS